MRFSLTVLHLQVVQDSKLNSILSLDLPKLNFKFDIGREQIGFDFKSDLKFDLKCALKIDLNPLKHVFFFGFNGLEIWYILGSFRGRWLQIRARNSEWRIQHDGKNSKIQLIMMIFGTWGFLESLITNLSSIFRNSKWRIQYDGAKCINLLDWDDICYSEIFDYESELKIQKFKMTDSIWRTKMQKVTWLRWYLVLGDFWGRWLWIWAENQKNSKWRIQHRGKKCKIYLFEIIFGTRGFLGSLITSLSWKFRNSKWRIQYGGPKCKKLLDWDYIWYSRIFDNADYKSELKNQKFKMTDPIWRTKIWKVT